MKFPVARDNALVLARGPALVWPGPGWDLATHEVTHAFATREIVSVTGSAEFGVDDPDRLVDRLYQVAGTLVAAVSSWGPNCSLELRYVATPDADMPTRLRLFLTAKGLAQADEEAIGVAETAVEAAVAALPANYRCEPAPAEATMPVGCGDALVEVRKQEEVTPPLIASVPAEYYYAVYPIDGDGSGWRQFMGILSRIREPVIVSLLFIPTAVHPLEQEAIGIVVSQLRYYAERREEQNLVGGMTYIQGDANAAAMVPAWEHSLHRLRRCLLVRMSVRGSRHGALAVAKALAAGVAANRQPTETAGGSSLAVQAPSGQWAQERAYYSFDWLQVVPWGGHPVWADESAPHTLRRLPYLYSLDEAASLAVLPVPDQQGAPGFPRSRRAETLRVTEARGERSRGPAVSLGRFMHEGTTAGEVSLPLTAINRHVLVVGVPGSGKTTTSLSILSRLWRELRIPFLAIEPVKVEYRSLIGMPGMEDIQVFTPGKESLSPLRMNPLAPGPGLTRLEHQSAVLASLKASMPLFPPLPELLEEALDRAYLTLGWGEETEADGGLRAPTLGELVAAFESHFATLTYTGEARNLLEAMRVRLRSLMKGGKGKLLNTIEVTDWNSLMERPVVIELGAITDPEEKAVVSAFLLQRVSAHARHRGNSGGQLRHVTMLEEAHQLLSADVEDGPRKAAVDALCHGIAELRAVGEGFVIADQRPTALAPAAVANCGTRVVHKLVSSADRDILLSDMDASDQLREVAARLVIGEGLLSWPDHDEPELVRIVSAPGVDTSVPIDDVTLRARVAGFRAGTLALMPFPLCTRGVCTTGCDPQRRSAAEAIAARERLKPGGFRGGPQETLAIGQKIMVDNDGDRPLAFCGVNHLLIGQEGSATAGVDPTVIRKRILKALDTTAAE